MENSNIKRYAFSAVVAAGLLSGCGGSQLPIAAPNVASASPQTLTFGLASRRSPSRAAERNVVDRRYKVSVPREGL